jgi:hypothetical protein
MIQYGGHALPGGHFGDMSTARRLEQPSADRLDRWLERLALPHTRYFAESYLEALGPALLARLGYSYDDLLAALRARPVRRPGLIVPWNVLMKPPEERTWRERLRVRLVVGLRQRGPGGSLRHGLRKLFGGAPAKRPS